MKILVNTNLKNGIYYEDKNRYSNILMIGHSCGDRCNRAYPPPRLRRRNIDGFRDCMSSCESAGSLDQIFSDSGTGGGTNENGGADEGPVRDLENGNGMNIKTILLWVGVVFLLIALIIGGAFAIKKIRA